MSSNNHIKIKLGEIMESLSYQYDRKKREAKNPKLVRGVFFCTPLTSKFIIKKTLKERYEENARS